MAIPAPIVTIVAFLVALGILVFVHELGHFAVAKRLGVKVLRFSIGFGPMHRSSRRRGETEYAVSAMPLGGYVKMLGEEDEEEALAEPERAFSTQPLPRRGAIVFAGPAMNFVFAFLVYALLFLSGGRRGAVERAARRRRRRGLAGRAGRPASWRPRARRRRQPDRPPGRALAQTVRDSKGAPLALTVEREGGQLTLTVTPKLRDARSVFGEDNGTGVPDRHRGLARLGSRRSAAGHRHGRAADGDRDATWSCRDSCMMVQGRVPLRELGGPIAIAQRGGPAGAGRARATSCRCSPSCRSISACSTCCRSRRSTADISRSSASRARSAGRCGSAIASWRSRSGCCSSLSLMVFVFYNDIHRLVQG